jgi:hypothetical protein
LGQPSFLNLQLFNISQSDILKIVPGSTIKLSVGYSLSGTGLIFSGQIYSIYTSLVAENDDINYVSNLYCFFDDSNNGKSGSDPVILDLPLGSISSQASVIASYYGYTENPKNKLPSIEDIQSPPIKLVADNIDATTLEFYRMTKFSIVLDSRTKTYNIVASQPTSIQRTEIAKTSSQTPIRIDNNTGMVGYPHFDSQTFYLKVSTLIRHELDYFSKISVDLSNSVIDNIDKNLSQNIIVQTRLYQSFTIISLSYIGDTRGQEWYQNILAVGES